MSAVPAHKTTLLHEHGEVFRGETPSSEARDDPPRGACWEGFLGLGSSCHGSS